MNKVISLLNKEWIVSLYGCTDILALTQLSSRNKIKRQIRYRIHPVQLVSDAGLNPLNTPAAQFSGLKGTYKSMTYRLRLIQLSTTEALYLRLAVAL